MLRDGQPVTLPPKDLETLLVLVENAGHIVEKEELLEKVWPGVFIEEGNLARHVFNLRQALGDTADGRPYIETIPRRGYRFVATVRERWEEVPELIVRERTKSTVIVEEEEETDVRTGILPAISPSKLAIISVLAIIVIGYSSYYLRNRADRSEEPSGQPFAGTELARRPSIAVLGLRNATGRADTAWLSSVPASVKELRNSNTSTLPSQADRNEGA